MTTLSPSMSYGLRLSVGVILTVSNVFLLIAISTNRWADTADEVYAGIWKRCNREFCQSHVEIIHAKIFLIFFLIFNILTNIAVILALWAGEVDRKKIIGKTCLFNAFLGIAGMISATVFFALAVDRRHILYGLPLGWLSTGLVVAAGIVSLVHAALEPDKSSTTIEDLIRGNKDPPPYPGTEAGPTTAAPTTATPTSIIVS
ncbi:transmembrane protein 202-like [Ranitomeya imitator]|uniref:transmembrane protein 202-like n=1 Tax=Ranitomeya imitator TaxID=111125 RepID=UPI0037E92412